MLMVDMYVRVLQMDAFQSDSAVGVLFERLNDDQSICVFVLFCG